MRLLTLFGLFAFLFPLPTRGTPAPDSYKGPVKVELLKFLSARQLQAGSSVFARVKGDWSGLGCTLRDGAIIEGKVVLASPRTKHNSVSQLALSFSSAQCGGLELAPFPLLLAAMSAAPESESAVPVIRNMGNPRGVPQGAISSLQQLSNQMQLAKTAKPAPSPTPAFGQVLGIRGVKLDVAAGPERSSLLSAKGRDIALEPHTLLLLVPTSIAFEARPASSSIVSRSDSSVTPAEVADAAIPADPVATPDFARCSPPSCSTDLPTATDRVSSHPVRSIPIRALGYAPRIDATFTALDNNESVAWIGEGRVLLAFNPHRLVHREGLTTSDAPLRSIHAVLIDLAQNRVISRLDWELSDSGKYLWQLSPDRILVHAGHELRAYNAQLRLVSNLLLPGSLAFLRVSPDRKTICVGIVRERHAPALHAQLQTDLGHQPPEDVDILVLDREFKMVAHSTTTSEILPPTLLNEGQVMLLAEPDHRYRLQILHWTGQETTMARFSSVCTPDLGSISPDFVFLRSCEPSTGAQEFRIIRPDGGLVLKGTADPGELEHEAGDGSASQTFAVRFLRASPSVRIGFPFKATDLNGEEIRVYRASDGRRIAAIHAEAPAPSRGGFALSPDGSQLAVVAGAQLSIYSVAAN